MSEYDAERTMQAPVDRVWEVASDVDRFPDWVPGVEAAAQPAADTVDVQRGEREVAGLLRVDADQRRVEWGSRGTGSYAGWLQVHAGSGGVSSVHLHLSFDDVDEDTGDGAPADVQATLEEALAGLAALVERP